MTLRPLLLLGLLFAGCDAGCGGPAPFKEPLKLADGRVIAPAVLDRGRVVYVQWCAACHGLDGKGAGAAAEGLRPPPRNFSTGHFKFGGTLQRDDAPTLPRDEDLQRIVLHGLNGTGMAAWDLPPPDLDAVLQYVKTFSPRWTKEAPGEPFVPTKDPWADKHDEGVKLGKQLFHVVAQCSACHPAYASKREIEALSREVNPEAPITEFREAMHDPIPTDSPEYALDGTDHPLRIVPTDLWSAPPKSVRKRHARDDLFRVISLGIPGAAMPPWREVLPDEQLWAIAHYLESLTAQRGTPAVAAEKRRIASEDQAWEAAHVKPDSGPQGTGGH